jgi:hypothetical protein
MGLNAEVNKEESLKKELIVGKYERYVNGKPDQNQSTILIEDVKNDLLHVKGDAVWVGNVETGNVNIGELDSLLPLKGNKIFYSDDIGDCKLTITFSENALEVSDDNFKCGGLNVTFNGQYNRGSL